MAKARTKKPYIDLWVQRELCAANQLGLHIKECCAMAGISERQFYFWQRKAEEDSDDGLECKAFMFKFQKSRIGLKKSLINDLIKSRDWKAKAYLLDRMDKIEAEQRNEPEEVVGNVDLSDVSDEKLKVLLKIIEGIPPEKMEEFEQLVQDWGEE